MPLLGHLPRAAARACRPARACSGALLQRLKEWYEYNQVLSPSGGHDFPCQKTWTATVAHSGCTATATSDSCRAGNVWESNPGPYFFVRSAFFSNFLQVMPLHHLRRWWKLPYATPPSVQMAEWHKEVAQMAEWHKEVAKNSTSDKPVIPGFRVPLNPPLGLKPTVPSTSASSRASCSRAYADGCRAGT